MEKLNELRLTDEETYCVYSFGEVSRRWFKEADRFPTVKDARNYAAWLMRQPDPRPLGTRVFKVSVSYEEVTDES
jgi:hypothetical protein